MMEAVRAFESRLLLRGNTAPNPIRLSSSYSPPWEPELSRIPNVYHNEDENGTNDIFQNTTIKLET
jgi:hypothetical protein